MYISSNFKRVSNITMYVIFLSGGFGLIGVIVYGSMDGYDSSKFHFSFAFCLIASLGAIAAGVLVPIGRNR